MKEFLLKLGKIQAAITVKKGQYNEHGKFHYRDCDDILAAVKPHLKEHALFLKLNDELVLIGNRYYLKSSAKITDGEHSEEVFAFAREPEEQKGMNAAQVTGSSSSYSRKRALEGLLGLSDGEDPDRLDNDDKTPEDRFKKPDNQLPPGEYLIPLGKFKDKKIKDVPRQELQDYCVYLTGQNPSLNGQMKVFIDTAREYLRTQKAQ